MKKPTYKELEKQLKKLENENIKLKNAYNFSLNKKVHYNSTYSSNTIASLKPGDHACCICSTDEEHCTLLTLFVRYGLEQNEKVLYIVDDSTPPTILDYLRKDGLEVQSYLTSGQLEIHTANEKYIHEGVFDPDRMIALLRNETELALSEGYTALRVTGEMTWALKDISVSERFIEYESKLNTFFPDSKCLALCQYDQRRFNPDILLDVLKTHPLAIIGTEIYKNFYYIPPQEFLRSELPSATLLHWIQNLSDQKKIETALKESEQGYKQLFEGIKDSVIVFDPEGKVLDCNKVTLERLGYTREEFLRLKPTEIVHPDFHHLLKKDIDKLWAGETLMIESALLRKDGSFIPIEVNGCRIEYRGELAILDVARDITDRKKVEDIQRLHSEIMQNMSEGVYLVRLSDCVILYTNPKFEEMFGYGPGEMVGKHVSIVNAPTEMSPEETEKHITGILKKTREWKGEIQNIKKDGTPFWCYASVSLFDYPEYGDIMISVHADITESKITEDKIRQQNEFLENILESLTHPFYVVDVNDYTIKMANSTARLGNLSENSTCYALTHKRDKPCDCTEYSCPIEKIKKTKKPEMVEHIHFDKDGNSRFFEIYGYPIFGEEGNIIQILLYSLDITERKKVEEALLKSESLLKHQKLALEKKTVALREVIRQIEVEKNTIKDDIITNVREIVFPILEKIKLENPNNGYIDLLGKLLGKLTTSLGRKITNITAKLTPREIEICAMIENGLTNKEISRLLNISSQTVEQHRKNIRKKLDISGKNINLVSFLKQLPS